MTAEHCFSYVNDEDPKSDSVLIRAVFANIKSTLKRDLQKWDNQLKQRQQAGVKSGESRRLKSTKTNDRSKSLNETNRKQTVSVNVSDIDKRLMSEIEISDVELGLVEYFKIAREFQLLFIKNLKEKQCSAVNQEKATFKRYVNPIRLMITNNECTIQDLRDVYDYLYGVNGEFWKKNILSTEKLREQMQKLIMSARETKNKPQRIMQDRL